MLNGPAEAKRAMLADGGAADALARAAAAIARLDQALRAHPLLPAFLNRFRLEAPKHSEPTTGWTGEGSELRFGRR